ncbi:hypothetical protein Mal4_31360 [Maioricimonas rarisocia]|uniref:Uncharacterized protein n=1 Tax=Maioricimonas rarisocia TaxID=2528026 RepID=A0A517Z8L3_9PLAN|nr:hypothetical protein [Maioricimonas rarisocia]QDU38806.1 hypothetical protein Mal4_31360 [Maioricimonas rarisocia]
MSIRFAGSRSVDERRRRRLAQEADVAATSPRQRSTSKATTAAPATTEATPTSLPAELPVVSVIPRSWWKHVTLAFTAILLLAGVVYWGYHLDQTGSGLAPALGLKAGRMSRFFSTVALLAAGQLSLLVLWHRAKSRKDFNGRYRIWFWAAIVWLVFCGAIATDAHRPAALLVLERWPLNAAQAPLLVWLVPASAITLAMTRLLRREMRACRASRYVLNFATMCAGIAAMTTLAGDLLLSETVHLLLLRTSTMTWHVGVALATLFHARYVIHVTNEPLRQRRHPGRRLLQPIFDALGHVRLPRIRLRLPRIGRPRLPVLRFSLRKPKLPRFSAPKLPRMRLPKVALPSLRLPRPTGRTEASSETPEPGSEVTGKEQNSESRPDASQTAEPRVSRKAARKSAKSSKAKSAAPQVQPEQDVQQTAPPATPQRKAPERKPPPPPAEPPQRKAPPKRVDPPQSHDDSPHADFENDRSLSKKERRRLRKLKRQAERQQARSGDDD